jgi:hypothetical protein
VTRAATTLPVRLLAVAALVGMLAACGTSPETRRKEAQSNGDKYWEFLKAGNPEGAYNNTFSSRYKRDLPLDLYLKFNKALEATFGTVRDYQVVHYDANPDRTLLVLTYRVETTNSQEPLMFDVKMGQEGTEWRVDQVEPKIPGQAPAAPPALPIRPPTKPPAPAKP